MLLLPPLPPTSLAFGSGMGARLAAQLSRAPLSRQALVPCHWGAAALLCLALSGCNSLSRLGDIGAAPGLTPIENPTAAADYQPISLPMPAPQPAQYAANSLWRAGARAFFKDQRATRSGDILTVKIEIRDSAKLNNTTTRSRNASENGGFTGLFGLETQVAKILPEGTNPANLVGVTSDNTHQGSGVIQRDETIALKVAAIVTQVLPNGNLAIQGRQEVQVNFERRDLYIAGVIRPEDIDSANSIPYDKIAEARISYGGRGQITDVQQPRYGQQLYDIVAPF
jgi:flagellar L-ring protein FlgH